MATADRVPFSVPDHVPPELVRNFDFMSEPGMKSCPHETLAQLHNGPRIVYNTLSEARLGTGSWLPTRAADIRAILSTPETFSAKGAGGFSALIGEDWDLLPVEADPPEHTEFRKLLNPLFSPGKVRDMEGMLRSRVVNLVEGLRDTGRCEFVTEFSQPFPISVIFDVIGLPKDHFDDLVAAAEQLLHGETLETKAAGCREIADYLRTIIAERRADPQDDLISYLIAGSVLGRSPTDDELLGMVFLLFGGGVDTVVASLGFYFKYLAENPQVQAELRSNPAKIPGIVDELLRSFSIVTSTRRVIHDVEFAGVAMRSGDWVSICSPLASLDPAEYDRPLEVDLDRKTPRHSAFSFGVHFCLGSHLAKREIPIAIEEWLNRIPEFRIDPEGEVLIHGGNLLGVDALPLVWS